MSNGIAGNGRNGNGAFVNWLLGIVGSLVVAGVIGLIAMTMSIGNKLADLDATIRENKAERQRVDARIDRRLDNLEADVREVQRLGR